MDAFSIKLQGDKRNFKKSTTKYSNKRKKIRKSKVKKSKRKIRKSTKMKRKSRKSTKMKRKSLRGGTRPQRQARVFGHGAGGHPAAVEHSRLTRPDQGFGAISTPTRLQEDNRRLGEHGIFPDQSHAHQAAQHWQDLKRIDDAEQRNRVEQNRAAILGPGHSYLTDQSDTDTGGPHTRTPKEVQKHERWMAQRNATMAGLGAGTIGTEESWVTRARKEAAAQKKIDDAEREAELPRSEQKRLRKAALAATAEQQRKDRFQQNLVHYDEEAPTAADNGYPPSPNAPAPGPGNVGHRHSTEEMDVMKRRGGEADAAAAELRDRYGGQKDYTHAKPDVPEGWGPWLWRSVMGGPEQSATNPQGVSRIERW